VNATASLAWTGRVKRNDISIRDRGDSERSDQFDVMESLRHICSPTLSEEHTTAL